MPSIRQQLNRMLSKIESALSTSEKADVNLRVFLGKDEVTRDDVRRLLGLDMIDKAAQWNYQRWIQSRLNAMGCPIDMDLGSRAPEVATNIPRLFLMGLHKMMVEAVITSAKADLLVEISEFFDESILSDPDFAPQIRTMVDKEFAELYSSEERFYQAAKLPYRPDDLWLMYQADCLGGRSLLGKEWDLPEATFKRYLDEDYRRGWLNYLLRREDQFAERPGDP